MLGQPSIDLLPETQDRLRSTERFLESQSAGSPGLGLHGSSLYTRAGSSGKPARARGVVAAQQPERRCGSSAALRFSGLGAVAGMTPPDRRAAARDCVERMVPSDKRERHLAEGFADGRRA